MKKALKFLLTLIAGLLLESYGSHLMAHGYSYGWLLMATGLCTIGVAMIEVAE